MTTTGGEGGEVVTVTTLDELIASAADMEPRVIQVKGTLAPGRVMVGSNKTIVGTCGARIQGHLRIDGSSNVIVRNLAVVGFNCTDTGGMGGRGGSAGTGSGGSGGRRGRGGGFEMGCEAGDDAITVVNGAHHIWFDHLDVSDGSDGNLDITNGSDFVTVSWTKLHYTTQRTDTGGAEGGHRFANLVGSSDMSAATDGGHLNVTFHHVWWAANVHERMPRVRFGHVHLFNNLNTAAGNMYCVGLGVGARIVAENNVFQGVAIPFNTQSYSDAASVLVAAGNVFTGTTGNTMGFGSNLPALPYTYTLDPVDGVAAAVMAGAGPR
jgi:pectate lyase